MPISPGTEAKPDPELSPTALAPDWLMVAPLLERSGCEVSASLSATREFSRLRTPMPSRMPAPVTASFSVIVTWVKLVVAPSFARRAPPLSPARLKPKVEFVAVRVPP